jgi:carbamoyltransferase
MVILGIHDGHNASAALVIDGRVVACVNEERLSRRKNEYGFPGGAIQLCLDLGGVEARHVDRVALATRCLPPKYFMTSRNATFTIADYWREQREYWYPRLVGGEVPAYLDVFKDKIEPERFVYDRALIAGEDDVDGMREARVRHLAASLGLDRSRITVYDHHSCHAYYGYGAAPVRDQSTLVFVADGAGDGANGSVWLGRPGQALVELVRTNRCNIGRIYRYATLILGMKQNEHEYKVMGLAPYANEDVGREAYRVYAETLQVDGLDFAYQVEPKDHFFHFKERLEGLRFDAIAYAVQRRTEELLTEWMGNGVRQTGVPRIVFSGGVALNVKASKRIAELDEVHELFVAPAPGDESISIGAAFQEFVRQRAGDARPMEALAPPETLYLGGEHGDAAVTHAIDRFEVRSRCRVRRAGIEEIADVLAAGGIVARFAGRMEFGPRALGNRSILADPRRGESARVINAMIKQRDFWLPFAPSILAERAADYLVNPKGIDARFMTVAFDSTPLARGDLAAALHPYDFTARPQLVSRAANRDYHALLSAFQRRTGVGAVLNTSFNLHGEPIVESPADALSTFERSGLQHLALGEWLISKPEVA